MPQDYVGSNWIPESVDQFVEDVSWTLFRSTEKRLVLFVSQFALKDYGG